MDHFQVTYVLNRIIYVPVVGLSQNRYTVLQACDPQWHTLSGFAMFSTSTCLPEVLAGLFFLWLITRAYPKWGLQCRETFRWCYSLTNWNESIPSRRNKSLTWVTVLPESHFKRTFQTGWGQLQKYLLQSILHPGTQSRQACRTTSCHFNLWHDFVFCWKISCRRILNIINFLKRLYNNKSFELEIEELSWAFNLC